jgi:hypothetical protein
LQKCVTEDYNKKHTIIGNFRKNAVKIVVEEFAS